MAVTWNWQELLWRYSFYLWLPRLVLTLYLLQAPILVISWDIRSMEYGYGCIRSRSLPFLLLLLLLLLCFSASCSPQLRLLWLASSTVWRRSPSRFLPSWSILHGATPPPYQVCYCIHSCLRFLFPGFLLCHHRLFVDVYFVNVTLATRHVHRVLAVAFELVVCLCLSCSLDLDLKAGTHTQSFSKALWRSYDLSWNLRQVFHFWGRWWL